MTFTTILKAAIGIGISFKAYRFYQKSYGTPLNLQQTYGPGSYALITGPTSGIGYQFCQSLAQKGFNIILVGRDIQKLEQAVSSLKANHQIDLKVIQADFNTSDFSLYERIESEVRNLDLSIVVLNAGLVLPGGTKDLEYDQIKSMTSVNVFQYPYLVKSLQQKLENRKQRSAIIIVSSIIGKFPKPGSSVYSATKAFQYAFATGLNLEVGKNVDVLKLCPAGIQTKALFGKDVKFVSTTEECVQGALRNLGRYSMTYGSVQHQFLGTGMEFLPEQVRSYILNKF